MNVLTSTSCLFLLTYDTQAVFTSFLFLETLTNKRSVSLGWPYCPSLPVLTSGLLLPGLSFCVTPPQRDLSMVPDLTPGPFSPQFLSQFVIAFVCLVTRI